MLDVVKPFLPSNGGINTELVVGDKEQVLGTNQDVKAESIGKVVGSNDNSTAVATAENVSVTNNSYPPSTVEVLMILCIIGWMAPTPTNIFKYFKKNKE